MQLARVMLAVVPVADKWVDKLFRLVELNTYIVWVWSQWV